MNLYTEGVSKGIGLSTYILSYCAGIPPRGNRK